MAMRSTWKLAAALFGLALTLLPTQKVSGQAPWDEASTPTIEYHNFSALPDAFGPYEGIRWSYKIKSGTLTSTGTDSPFFYSINDRLLFQCRPRNPWTAYAYGWDEFEFSLENYSSYPYDSFSFEASGYIPYNFLQWEMDNMIDHSTYDRVTIKAVGYLRAYTWQWYQDVKTFEVDLGTYDLN